MVGFDIRNFKKIGQAKQEKHQLQSHLLAQVITAIRGQKLPRTREELASMQAQLKGGGVLTDHAKERLNKLARKYGVLSDGPLSALKTHPLDVMPKPLLPPTAALGIPHHKTHLGATNGTHW